MGKGVACHCKKDNPSPSSSKCWNERPRSSAMEASPAPQTGGGDPADAARGNGGKPHLDYLGENSVFRFLRRFHDGYDRVEVLTRYE